MVAVPGVSALTSPVCDTVAMVPWSDVHRIWDASDDGALVDNCTEPVAANCTNDGITTNWVVDVVVS